MDISTCNDEKVHFKRAALVVFFAISFLALVLYFLQYAQNPSLAFLAGITGLLILMATFLAWCREGFFSPLLIFSVMYSGYVIGGLYYSCADEDFGKFVGFLSLEREDIVVLMQYGLAYVAICYFVFCFGYFIFSRGARIDFQIKKSGFIIFFEKYYMYFALPLLAIGLAYWYWVSVVTAGGLLNLIIYFQVFRHLVAESSVTTLPYHFYYAGIFIWLLGSMVKFGRVSILFWVFSLVGMIINLTQGRITLSVTFVLAQVVFVALFDTSKEKKAVKVVGFIILLAFVVYFLRIASNYFFIGKEFEVSEFGFFEMIIGGGNVADLQQLVIIFKTFDPNSLLIGASYFDWLRNSVGGLLGMPPSSVGLIIKDLYVPESSGAPTPGAIGEAYANFYVGGTLLLFFVGLSFHFIRKISLKSGNPILLLVYSIFLTRFVFIYPKVDSTMLVNFLWGVTPFLAAMIFIYFLYSWAKFSRNCLSCDLGGVR